MKNKRNPGKKNPSGRADGKSEYSCQFVSCQIGGSKVKIHAEFVDMKVGAGIPAVLMSVNDAVDVVFYD